MKLVEFNYELPNELIAQYPIKERDRCRLMVMDRMTRSISHRIFTDIPEYFKSGDCLVLNNTKVIPARLFGRRASGGKVEIFLTEKKNPVSEALIRPSARIRDGEEITLESGDRVRVLGLGKIGRFIEFFRSVDEVIALSGHIPLPPYIARRDEDLDKSEYQTVFGSREGATAAPTAGLHFTDDLLERIRNIGVRIAYVTLHTNYGTFASIKSDIIEYHKMHSEFYELTGENARIIKDSKAAGGKIFAVGTTANRVLEWRGADLKAGSGWTDLYIYPGYEFKVVDHLITNFHLPKSTLLILVSAFAGKEFIMEAYKKAIEERYRFFSYGDATLIL